MQWMHSALSRKPTSHRRRVGCCRVGGSNLLRTIVSLRRRPSVLTCWLALSPWLMSCVTIISPIEVLSSDDLGHRRDWSDAEKVRIAEESLQGFRQGSVTARRYGLSRSLLTRWRREYRSGLLSVSASTSFVPLSISPPTAASS